MLWSWFNKYLSRRTPDHHQTIDFLFVLKLVDVGTNTVEHLALRDLAHGVVGIYVLDVVALESSLHWAHIAQCIRDRLEVLAAFQHTSALCCYVCIIWKRIPRTPHDVFDAGEWNEIFDHRIATIGALAKTDGVHLGE